MAPGLISVFFLMIFLCTVGVIIVGTYVNPGNFKLLDWAISYDGGFVRRGLAGAVFGYLHDLFGWSIQHQVFFVKVLLYGVFLATVYGLLRAIRFSPAAVLLVYSPFFLVFQISEWRAAGRKEIVFLAAFALLCLVIARDRDNRHTFLAFALFLLSAPILVLMHEASFFFLVWALALAIALGLDRKLLIKLSVLAIPAMISMAYVVFFPAAEHTILAICGGLEGRLGVPEMETSCATTENAVTWLSGNAGTGIQALRSRMPDMLLTLPPALLLVGLAFLPFSTALQGWTYAQRRALALGAGLAMLATVPLFVVAIDWGRFVYVNATSFGLLLVALLARRMQLNTPLPVIAIPLPLVALYFFGWSLRYLDILVGGGFILDIGSRLLLGPL